MFELFFIFTCRSDKKLTEIGIFSNKYLIFAFLISLALTLIVIYTPISGIFMLTSISLSDWLLIIPFAVSGLVIFEIAKGIKSFIKEKKKNVSK